MKLALISDIHGNLPALEAVLRSIKNERVDSIICLGDIVGYGARPNECIELLKDENIPSILGNHDATVIGRLSPSFMNSNARVASEWTIEQLTKINIEFLKSLPLTLEFETILCVHSSPDEPEQWHYLFKNSDTSAGFRSFSQLVCFFGHTHFPVIFTNPSDGRRLINVGSVGQPRDHDSRSCYGIYNTSTADFLWVRVEYPIAEAAKHIIDAGLPPYLAQRLATGT